MSEEQTQENESYTLGSHVDAVASDLGDIEPIVKAHIVGGDIGGSRQLDTDQSGFAEIGDVLTPPYDPMTLCMLHEHSSSLRQNIDAYATNVDGFGHRFEPMVELEDPEVASDAIKEEFGDDLDETAIKSKIEELKKEMRAERRRLTQFFQYAADDMSFVQLRKLTRQDLEVMGNGYWEVTRTKGGEIARFLYMPSYTVRLLKMNGGSVEVDERVGDGLNSVRTVTVRKRFRRFVQLVEGHRTYFKEFGDPRVMSSKTGKYYASAEIMIAEEPNGSEEATEVIHFKIHSTRSAYGVPRWIGNLLSVLGSRQAEEINFMYFENKSIPPLAILVSGGKLKKDAVARLQDYVQTHIKGKQNFHKILILEGEPAVGNSISNEHSSRVKIEIKPLMSAQQSDALFQKYDQTNRDKIGESFRIPRLLRGDMRDFNRSTAFAALSFAEQQVFQPERQEFDFVMNRKVLPMIEKKLLHSFVSLAPVTRDPVAMSEMLKNLANANILVPEESRELAGDVFNRTFRKIKSVWTKQPAAFTLAGIAMEDGEGSDRIGQDKKPPPAKPKGEQGDNERTALAGFAKILVALRKEILKRNEEEVAEEFRLVHSRVNSVGEVDDIAIEDLERVFGESSAA